MGTASTNITGLLTQSFISCLKWKAVSKVKSDLWDKIFCNIWQKYSHFRRLHILIIPTGPDKGLHVNLTCNRVPFYISKGTKWTKGPTFLQRRALIKWRRDRLYNSQRGTHYTRNVTALHMQRCPPYMGKWGSLTWAREPYKLVVVCTHLFYLFFLLIWTTWCHFCGMLWCDSSVVHSPWCPP